MNVRRMSLPVATLLTGLMIGAVGTSFAAGTFEGFPTASVVLNGKPIQSEVPAIIVAGRTLLPVRAISEALGLEVAWNQETSTVTLTAKVSKEAVTFGNLKVVKQFSQNVVIGEVKNTSSAAVRGIVAIAFYDGAGKLLTRTTGAFPAVAPGETKTFETMSVTDADIAGYATMKAEVDMVLNQ